ncbi:MAG TPA: DUF4159 domain-containing protein [Pirellulales bacterium]|nr:DUF4159 domain-containing protein [Pirellulales bacterium]
MNSSRARSANFWRPIPFPSLVRPLLVLALCLAGASAALAERPLGTIGPPQRKTPQRQTSAESLPPLPLPATPMRRSEPKAEPKGPMFISRLVYGADQDYMPNPGDVDNLLRHVRYQVDSWYGETTVKLDELVALHREGKVYNVPVIYMVGYQAFSFTADERAALAAYLVDGGTLLATAALGSKQFTDSFATEMKAIFPDRRFDALPLDHPILRAYYPYSNVHYFQAAEGTNSKNQGPPVLLGLNIAARTAVIYSPYDMTCGWDEFYAPAAPRSGGAKPEVTQAIMPDDAIRLGVNIVSYVAADRRFAVAQADTREILGEQPEHRAAVTIGHLRHQGDWNADPNSLYQLLRLAHDRTSIPIAFDIKPVDANVEQLAETPVLLMTGMDDPALGPDEVQALRRHLNAGGFLFINNTSGFSRFDRYARQLVAAIYPDEKLVPVPDDHPLVAGLYKLDALHDAGTLAERERQLEMVSVRSRAVIVYSPVDTLALLKGIHDSYANAYDADSARRVSLNILSYALRH